MNENHPHYVWAFVAIVVVSIFAWIYTSNRPDVQTYEKGSAHPEITNNYYPLTLPFGGCMSIKADGTPVRPYKDTVKK